MITVPIKACCLILLGEVCDCPPGTIAADPQPSANYPKPLILVNVGGLLRVKADQP